MNSYTRIKGGLHHLRVVSKAPLAASGKSWAAGQLAARALQVMALTFQTRLTLLSLEDNNSLLKTLRCMAKDKKAKHKKEKDKKRKRDDEDDAKQAEKARKLVRTHVPDACTKESFSSIVGTACNAR